MRHYSTAVAPLSTATARPLKCKHCCDRTSGVLQRVVLFWWHVQQQYRTRRNRSAPTITNAAAADAAPATPTPAHFAFTHGIASRIGRRGGGYQVFKCSKAKASEILNNWRPHFFTRSRPRC